MVPKETPDRVKPLKSGRGGSGIHVTTRIVTVAGPTRAEDLNAEKKRGRNAMSSRKFGRCRMFKKTPLVFFLL
jgi:hypothetical protein